MNNSANNRKSVNNRNNVNNRDSINIKNNRNVKNITNNKRVRFKDFPEDDLQKSSSDIIYFYSIMFATLLYCFSYIPMMGEVIQHKRTHNLPYATFFLTLCSSMIFIMVCLSKGYYVHFIFFLVLFTCSLIVILFKLKYEHNERFSSTTPSNGPKESWEEIANQIRSHNQCDIIPKYQKYFKKSQCSIIQK